MNTLLMTATPTPSTDNIIPQLRAIDSSISIGTSVDGTVYGTCTGYKNTWMGSAVELSLETPTDNLYTFKLTYIDLAPGIYPKYDFAPCPGRDGRTGHKVGVAVFPTSGVVRAGTWKLPTLATKE